MAARSRVSPLRRIAEDREITRRARTRDRSVMISSVSPSLKYSVSGSGLRLAKGSTTIDFVPAGSDAAADERRTAKGPEHVARLAQVAQAAGGLAFETLLDEERGPHAGRWPAAPANRPRPAARMRGSR